MPAEYNSNTQKFPLLNSILDRPRGLPAQDLFYKRSTVHAVFFASLSRHICFCEALLEHQTTIFCTYGLVTRTVVQFIALIGARQLHLVTESKIYNAVIVIGLSLIPRGTYPNWAKDLRGLNRNRLEGQAASLGWLVPDLRLILFIRGAQMRQF